MEKCKEGAESAEMLDMLVCAFACVCVCVCVRACGRISRKRAALTGPSRASNVHVHIYIDIHMDVNRHLGM